MIVHLHTDRFATIAISPPLVARVLFGRRSEDRFAVRVASRWFYDDTGRAVEPGVQAAIDREVAAARNEARA